MAAAFRPPTALFDQVELRQPVDHVAVGATGAVIEFDGDGEVAMVEFTSLPADPILGRIVFVPLSKLRRVEEPSGSSAGPD